MRLLVLSDSHDDYISLKMAIADNKDADAVIFLGDGLDDWNMVESSLRNKIQIAVKGNCDSAFVPYPAKAVEKFGNTVTYCTHGYAEKVKYGLDVLLDAAKAENATLVLYGHTHTPYVGYKDGIYILNPGSVRNNSCGIVDITDNGIMCFNKKIVVPY